MLKPESTFFTLLRDKEACFFRTPWSSNPRTPKIYMSPKTYNKNNPGRPVISSINGHTSKIPKYVDYHLHPIVKEIPSYVKDTSDFINKINNHNIPKGSIFVTLDVKSLFTSIPNPEGIAAVKKPTNAINTKQFQQRS